ncbi:hypothetical protein [Microbulbifer sediminum]|uniref:hypothetical protein n=1 Tax=Microbulbifer sediminum TaxID=2904250 RepID=UPI001F2BFB4B|nr:hypothetical protein [Microbulbifer sediminum]
MPFADNPRDPMPEEMSLRLRDYTKLVDWSDRCLREDQRRAIDSKLPPILEPLQIDSRHWLYLYRHFESCFKSLLGSSQRRESAGPTGFANASAPFHRQLPSPSL